MAEDEGQRRTTLLELLKKKERDLKVVETKLARLEQRYVDVVRQNRNLQNDKKQLVLFLKEVGFLNQVDDASFDTAEKLDQLRLWAERAYQDRSTLELFVQMIFPNDNELATLSRDRQRPLNFDVLRNRWIEYEELYSQSVAAVQVAARESIAGYEAKLLDEGEQRRKLEMALRRVQTELETINREKAQLLVSRMHGPSGNAQVPSLPLRDHSVGLCSQRPQVPSPSRNQMPLRCNDGRHQSPHTRTPRDVVVVHNAGSPSASDSGPMLSGGVKTAAMPDADGGDAVRKESPTINRSPRGVTYINNGVSEADTARSVAARARESPRPPDESRTNVAVGSPRSSPPPSSPIPQGNNTVNPQSAASAETAGGEGFVSLENEEQEGIREDNAVKPNGTLQQVVDMLKLEKQMLETELSISRSQARDMLRAKDSAVEKLRSKVHHLERGVSAEDEFWRKWAEKQANRDTELVDMRFEIANMKRSVQDVEAVAERERAQCSLLKLHIRELERSSQRTHVNMDYLKNVVVQYLEFSRKGDAAAHLLVPVICKVLALDAEEEKRVAPPPANRKNLVSDFTGLA